MFGKLSHIERDMLPLLHRTIELMQKRWLSIINRWEVMRMKYEFKDLMIFGIIFNA